MADDGYESPDLMPPRKTGGSETKSAGSNNGNPTVSATNGSRPRTSETQKNLAGGVNAVPSPSTDRQLGGSAGPQAAVSSSRNSNATEKKKQNMMDDDQQASDDESEVTLEDIAEELRLAFAHVSPEEQEQMRQLNNFAARVFKQAMTFATLVRAQFGSKDYNAKFRAKQARDIAKALLTDFPTSIFDAAVDKVEALLREVAKNIAKTKVLRERLDLRKSVVLRIEQAVSGLVKQRFPGVLQQMAEWTPSLYRKWHSVIRRAAMALIELGEQLPTRTSPCVPVSTADLEDIVAAAPAEQRPALERWKASVLSFQEGLVLGPHNQVFHVKAEFGPLAGDVAHLVSPAVALPFDIDTRYFKIVPRPSNLLEGITMSIFECDSKGSAESVMYEPHVRSILLNRERMPGFSVGLQRIKLKDAIEQSGLNEPPYELEMKSSSQKSRSQSNSNSSNSNSGAASTGGTAQPMALDKPAAPVQDSSHNAAATGFGGLTAGSVGLAYSSPFEGGNAAMAAAAGDDSHATMSDGDNLERHDDEGPEESGEGDGGESETGEGDEGEDGKQSKKRKRPEHEEDWQVGDDGSDSEDEEEKEKSGKGRSEDPDAKPKRKRRKRDDDESGEDEEAIEGDDEQVDMRRQIPGVKQLVAIWQQKHFLQDSCLFDEADAGVADADVEPVNRGEAKNGKDAKAGEGGEPPVVEAVAVEVKQPSLVETILRAPSNFARLAAIQDVTQQFNSAVTQANEVFLAAAGEQKMQVVAEGAAQDGEAEAAMAIQVELKESEKEVMQKLLTVQHPIGPLALVQSLLARAAEADLRQLKGLGDEKTPAAVAKFLFPGATEAKLRTVERRIRLDNYYRSVFGKYPLLAIYAGPVAGREAAIRALEKALDIAAALENLPPWAAVIIADAKAGRRPVPPAGKARAQKLLDRLQPAKGDVNCVKLGLAIADLLQRPAGEVPDVLSAEMIEELSGEVSRDFILEYSTGKKRVKFKELTSTQGTVNDVSKPEKMGGAEKGDGKEVKWEGPFTLPELRKRLINSDRDPVDRSARAFLYILQKNEVKVQADGKATVKKKMQAAHFTVYVLNAWDEALLLDVQEGIARSTLPHWWKDSLYCGYIFMMTF